MTKEQDERPTMTEVVMGAERHVRGVLAKARDKAVARYVKENPKPLPKKHMDALRVLAASKGPALKHNRREARAILAALEYERQRTERVLAAGQRLSNAAFNLSQLEGKKLGADDVRSLRESYKAWDEATKPPQSVRKRAAPRRRK